MGKQWKQWQAIFFSSKITADGDCSHEIKRRLFLGRKVMTNINSKLINRNITLASETHIVKAMVFPLVMYGCESCPIKKAECQSIDTFELCFGEDPWESLGLQGDPTCPSYSPEYSLEGLMLKLTFQYFSHLIWRTSLERTLILGKI